MMRTFGERYSDVLVEAKWGNDYLLKCQDPLAGAIYPSVGGGEDDFRLTDNIPASGDERAVRFKVRPELFID